MAKGGTRIGGKPKGYKAPATLEKEAAREYVRLKVMAKLDALVDAQIANAQGLKYLVARDEKTGRFERIAATAVRSDSHIEVWEKDPSVQAFSDIMNRALDKPKEQVQEIAVSGSVDMHQVIAEGRQRAAKRNRKP